MSDTEGERRRDLVNEVRTMNSLMAGRNEQVERLEQRVSANTTSIFLLKMVAVVLGVTALSSVTGSFFALKASNKAADAGTYLVECTTASKTREVAPGTTVVVDRHECFEAGAGRSRAAVFGLVDHMDLLVCLFSDADIKLPPAVSGEQPRTCGEVRAKVAAGR